MPDANPAEAPKDALARAVAEVIEANQAARADLMEAVDALTPDRRQERWYGEWSVHDILAHLYEWQDGFAHALERMARGERPEIPDYNPEDADDAFNALVTERNRDRSWEDLVTRLRAARERHEAAVRNLVGRIPPDRFEEGRTARRLADSAEHDREHIPAILQWRREQGI
ncbi:MAG: ClbS/DfsB family four-helix bundle protein [Dehalococcoidia bacterium]|nr:ClbS/DfsB family four-helix bundle protein [Dehalococcoidia bacterium]